MIDPKEWRCTACDSLMSEACEDCKAQLTPPVNVPLLTASELCKSTSDWLEKAAWTEPSYMTGYDPHSAYARLDRCERALIELLRAQALLLRFLSGDQDD